MPQQETFWFADPQVWIAAAAALALALNLEQRLRQWIRRTSLEFKVLPRIVISHMMGNIVCNLWVVLNNTGQRRITLTGLSLDFKHDSGERVSLPSRSYVPRVGQNVLPLFELTLPPDRRWQTYVEFYGEFSREDDGPSRDITARIKQEIAENLLKEQLRQGRPQCGAEACKEAREFF